MIGVRRTAKRLLKGMLRTLRGPDWRLAPLKGSDAILWVDASTGFGQQLLAYGERPSEPFMIPLLARLLGPGDTYVDVGAHWGVYAVAASRIVGPKGRVVAVEPYPSSADALRRSAEHNNCSNLSLVRAALSDRAGQGRLIVGEGGAVGPSRAGTAHCWRGR